MTFECITYRTHIKNPKRYALNDIITHTHKKNVGKDVQKNKQINK